MGADPARDGGKAGLTLAGFFGRELDQDLPFANRLTNAAGDSFNPAGARGGETKDSLHRLQHHKHFAARDFLAFAC